MAVTDDKIRTSARWITFFFAAWSVFTALNVMPVLSQGTGSLTGPVHFLENYESRSDAQHFRLLNSGQQVQLVLDEYSGTPQRIPAESFKCPFVLGCT